MKFFLALFTALLVSVCAQADISGVDDSHAQQTPLASCYDPAASARSGDSMLQKLDLATISMSGRAFGLAGKGIQMIDQTGTSVPNANPNYPVLFTVGGPYAQVSPGPQSVTYSFRQGSAVVKYLEYTQTPYQITAITLDRRLAMVSIEITDGHIAGTLTAKGCVFH